MIGRLSGLSPISPFGKWGFYVGARMPNRSSIMIHDLRLPASGPLLVLVEGTHDIAFLRRVGPGDVRTLLSALPKLAAADPEQFPITLDLGDKVTIQARPQG